MLIYISFKEMVWRILAKNDGNTFFRDQPELASMDYLSSGFSRVDRSHDPGVYFSCLQTLSSLPYFQDCKKRSFQLLSPEECSRVLEVGCGLGQDAISLARTRGENGHVVAIDSSRKMIQAACRTPEYGTNFIEFCVADACNLPFRDGAFDGARADRVLQHIPDPRRAFLEMVRTVRAGGRIVVYEPDWGTFIISPGEKEICMTMTQLFGDTFPSGWVGRQLPGLFREEGLERLQIEASTFYTCDLTLAIQVFDLVCNAHRAESLGYVSSDQAEGWLEGLRRACNQGRFFCSYTGFLVSGEKP